jgi:cytochrome c5
MKNQNRYLSLLLAVTALLAFLAVPVSSYSQKKTRQETLALFPDNVSPVFNSSCIGCHSDQSNGKAKTFLNFSEWDKLNAKDRAKTAKQIRKVVTKGTMPPAGFLEKKPDAALSAVQVACISAWSKTVKKSH